VVLLDPHADVETTGANEDREQQRCPGGQDAAARALRHLLAKVVVVAAESFPAVRV
jgi:hypothetical protein